jgi:predicted MFS family arabinose efflux permease
MRKLLPLAGSVAVIGANSLALSPIAGAVAESFPGVDAAGVMRAAAAYGLATAASALVLAPAIDRIGLRAALTRSLLVLAAGLALSAAARNVPILCFAQALAGLAAGCALPAIYALAARMADQGRGSETLGFVLTGWSVSLVVGVALSALIADFGHWRLVFATLAIAAAALAAVIRRARSLALPVSTARPETPLAAFRVPGIGPALLTVAVFMTAFYGLYAYLGPHLTQILRLPTAAAGLAPAAYGLGFGIAAFGDRLLDRYGPVASGPVAFLGLVLVYVFLAAAADDAAMLVALCFFWGLANHVGLNLIVDRLAGLDPARAGAIMGLYGAVTYLAVSAGALLYEPLFAHFGFAGCALASVCFVIPVLAMALIRAWPKPLLLVRRNGG